MLKIDLVIKEMVMKEMKYIHIDENNNLSIIVPIISGLHIGLDNTCKSNVELPPLNRST